MKLVGVGNGSKWMNRSHYHQNPPQYAMVKPNESIAHVISSPGGFCILWVGGDRNLFAKPYIFPLHNDRNHNIAILSRRRYTQILFPIPRSPFPVPRSLKPETLYLMRREKRYNVAKSSNKKPPEGGQKPTLK